MSGKQAVAGSSLQIWILTSQLSKHGFHPHQRIAHHIAQLPPATGIRLRQPSVRADGDFQTYYIAATMPRAGEDIHDHRRALQFTAAHPSVAYPEVPHYFYSPL